jgi:thymidylate synthase
MPIGDPWPGIDLLLQAESAIRNKGALAVAGLADVDPYWADLIRLLQVFRCKTDKNADTVKGLREAMSSQIYLPFIDNVIARLS